MNKEEWFNLPKINKFDDNFKNKKFDKEMALGLLNETQSHWCLCCENYKENACGCYFPAFKQEMIKKINEHFDNPPLKFEELKDFMWVWDNKHKDYVKIVEINENGEFYNREIVTYFELGNIPRNFEENRFYRYEVVEEDE